MAYFSVRVIVSFGLEGWVPYSQLIAQNTYSPDVNRLVVRLPTNHLWRKII